MNLATLKIANGHKYSKEQIVAWLKMFCNGDKLNVDFQKRIIDVLVNSVYVYDDKVVIYYNVEGGKQVSYIEMCDSIEDSTPFDAQEKANGGVRISNTPPRQRNTSAVNFGKGRSNLSRFFSKREKIFLVTMSQQKTTIFDRKLSFQSVEKVQQTLDFFKLM